MKTISIKQYTTPDFTRPSVDNTISSCDDNDILFVPYGGKNSPLNGNKFSLASGKCEGSHFRIYALGGHNKYYDKGDFILGESYQTSEGHWVTPLSI